MDFALVSLSCDLGTEYAPAPSEHTVTYEIYSVTSILSMLNIFNIFCTGLKSSSMTLMQMLIKCSRIDI